MADPTTTSTWRAGLVLVRPTRQLRAEAFFQELIAGIENVLIPAHATLVTQIVLDRTAEDAVYRRWAAAHSVDAVFLTHMKADDARIPLLRELGFQGLIIGDPDIAQGLPSVWTDHVSATRLGISVLAGFGHKTIARVTGPSSLRNTQLRSGAFLAECAAAEINAAMAEGDYTAESGQVATRELIGARTRPTAIIYDNDLMALGGLTELQHTGLSVPGDVSVLAWDDSMQCQLATPSLSALGHDVQIIGEAAAHALLRFRHSGDTSPIETPKLTLIQRESIAATPYAVAAPS